MTAPTLIQLCRDCGHNVYGARPPSPRYGEAAARLLMGTAATESLLVHRRQLAYTLGDNDGAWGLWQTEQDAVTDSVNLLRRRGDLRRRAGSFLYDGAGNIELDGLLAMGTHGILRAIHDSDRLACLFARLHYYRFAAPIPEALTEQAMYYKRLYNTSTGKGSPEKYMADWRRLVEPAL